MITYAKYTNIGEREDNEDSVMSIYEENIGYSFVVADGLGGHGKGKEASDMVVNVFKKQFEDINKKISEKEDEEFSMEEYLKSSFKKAQEILEDEQNKINSPNELKTTGVALTISENKLMWGHIGDSRLYLFNNNKLVERTLDHSVPQMLVLAKELKEKKIRNHPDRNRLLRVLGARNIELKVDFSDIKDVDECQAFLMCSDGFWECITERKMVKFLRKSKTVEEWLSMMVKEVEKNGKGTNMDNNSAIAVWVNENRSGRLWK